MRGHCDTMQTFRDSSQHFGESIRKPIGNSSHPSEIGALPTLKEVSSRFSTAVAKAKDRFHQGLAQIS